MMTENLWNYKKGFNQADNEKEKQGGISNLTACSLSPTTVSLVSNTGRLFTGLLLCALNWTLEKHEWRGSLERLSVLVMQHSSIE